MSGFGRGGRGQALLDALQKPVRKPGTPPAQEQTRTENVVSPSVPPSVPSLSSLNFPLGRGLRGKTVSNMECAIDIGLPSLARTASQQTQEVVRPLGRGLCALSLGQDKTKELTLQKVGDPCQAKMVSPRPSSTPTRELGRGQSPKRLPGGQSVLPAVSSVSVAAMNGLSLGGSVSTKISAKEAAAKRGTNGRSVLLNANYLALQGKSEGVYQYAVSYEPLVENKSHRYGLLAEHHEMLGRTRAFDGAILYLPKKITDSSIVLSSTRKTDGVAIAVTVTLVTMVQYVQCMQLFNVIFRRVLRALDLTEVGRNFYDPHSPIAIPQHKMELWPGYVSAIQQHDAGVLLLFDVSHRLLRTDTALDFMYELYAANATTFQDAATKVLVGVVVLTRYNNKTYRIDDIAWDKNPLCTFLDHKGNSISFIDYYKSMYGKDICDHEQPLLIHRPRRRDQNNKDMEEVICLIPELCSMTGLTDQARQDYKIMKDIATYTRIAPNQREANFRKFVDRVNQCPKAREELETWGLQLNPEMIQLEGRQLNCENIMFRNATHTAGPEADWGRQAVKENVILAVPLNSWVVMVTKRDYSKAYDFVEMMKKVCPSLGINLCVPKILKLHDDRTDTYIQCLRQEINSKLQLVIAIFPTSRDDRYSAFKKFCCIECPVPSQVINSRTIAQQHKLHSVTQKIALQINCKLGGELWAVEIPVKNLMVVGLDVYHDSAQGQKRSILGFVASTNPYLTRWYSRVDIQGVRQEIADGLKVCFKAALEHYEEVNSCLPNRIVVYRDGVGDGQMHVVAQYEVPQMTSCFTLLARDYQPKMAVVVVQKRISTRIFQRGGPTGLVNPAPGTILDHTITRKGWYDFFLVSQHVRQGTVTPTHYNVVYDTSGFKPDHLQRLSYKLTHMYYNWPGTIRVPAPCQYAHKLAFLVGQSLHRSPSLSLSDRLFFL